MKIFFSLFFLTTLFLTPLQAYAVDFPASGGDDGTVNIRRSIEKINPLYPKLEFGGGNALGSIITNAVVAVMMFASIATFLYLLWGGFNWLTAGDDKAKVESARNRMTNAIIGLALVMSIWVIYGIVDAFFGIGNLS